MPISFPSNPSTNDTYTVNGRTYIWTGEKWRRNRYRIEYTPPTMDVSNDFSAGGALHVDASTGRIGIGTSTPATDLHVDGNVEFTGTLDVTGLITSATASAVTNDTTVATTAYVQTALAGLVDSAPSTLDTLNELAAALGDDANFATTVTNSIATKQDASTALTTSTTFGGDVSGTYNAIVIADDSHNHTIANVDNLQTTLDGKAASSHSHSNYVTTTYNSSLNSDSRNTLGPTRLYRRDHNSDYSVQTYWTGARWRLYGYVGDSNHADTHVGYADSAGNADTVDGNHASAFATSGHTHSYLPTSGGTINGSINVTSVSQSNEFQGDVGSASDVTYMFDGDTDTGMYRYGSGEAALSGNGSWRIRTVGYGVAVNYAVNMSAGTYNHSVCGGAANQIAFRWASPYLKGSIDNVICANITNFSDSRLKANIRDWDDGLSIVRQLRTVEYTPRDVIGFGEISGSPIEGLEPKDDIIGLIAQEVREVLPSAVSGDPDGTELLSIAEDQIMAVVISALQNIDARLTALEGS